MEREGVLRGPFVDLAGGGRARGQVKSVARFRGRWLARLRRLAIG